MSLAHNPACTGVVAAHEDAITNCVYLLFAIGANVIIGHPNEAGEVFEKYPAFVPPSVSGSIILFAFTLHDTSRACVGVVVQIQKLPLASNNILDALVIVKFMLFTPLRFRLVQACVLQTVRCELFDDIALLAIVVFHTMIVQDTCNAAVGVVVPIQTYQEFIILIASILQLVALLTTKAIGKDGDDVNWFTVEPKAQVQEGAQAKPQPNQKFIEPLGFAQEFESPIYVFEAVVPGYRNKFVAFAASFAWIIILPTPATDCGTNKVDVVHNVSMFQDTVSLLVGAFVQIHTLPVFVL